MSSYLYWIPGHHVEVDSDKWDMPLSDIVEILDNWFLRDEGDMIEASTDLMNEIFNFTKE